MTENGFGKRQKLIAGLIVLAMVLVCAGSFWADQQGRSRRDPAMDGWEEHTVYWFDVFDTVTRVVGYAPSQEEWTRQVTALHEDLLAYHQLYDIYNSYPGVTSLKDVNEQAGEGPVKVDRRTLEMLKLAREMNAVTNGQLNIAMGSMLTVWHEYRTAGLENPELAALPSRRELEEAAEHSDIRNLILDESAGTVAFADPEMKLDVGSVGKGYAVEMVARAARERGLTSAFISVGGNLRAIGHRPDGSSWSGGVQNPWETDKTLCAVEVKDGESLVTSGDYLRYYIVDGQEYCHLIDPDTLYPAEWMNGVSVLCADSGLADCLSTGLFCMSPEEGLALVESMEGVEACWQLQDGQVLYSSGFKSRLA